MSSEDGDFFEDQDLPRVKKVEAPQSFQVEEEDVEQGGGAIGHMLRNSSHPGVALFHLGFKLAAVASYLLLGIFLKNFIVQFVVTVIFLAFDFWTTKNVSGRLLVGLRWWTDVNDDGSTTWRFECIDDAGVVNTADSRIFWWSMYLSPLAWIGLGLICILRFEFRWLLVVIVALVLTCTNLYAYFKCSRKQQEQITNYVRSTVIDSVMGYFRGGAST